MSHARYPEWHAESAEALIAPIVANEPGPVLLCLQAVQAHFGYVPGDAVAMIADACNVTRADVHGVLGRDRARGRAIRLQPNLTLRHGVHLRAAR